MRRVAGPLLVSLSLLISLAALAVGGIAYYRATVLQRGILEAVTQTRAALASLPGRTVEVPIHIQETLPISAQIPVQEEFAVPIHTVLPVSTNVEVPLNIPVLGERRISIPIQADVPIHIEVVIPISKTVSLETSVAVNLQVPVRIDLDTLGIEGLLEEVDARLAEIERQLR
ncbi:MAG: hypothetical protein H5T61_02615 [Thermoflexales bacterium]|nr:hypothetical protein [Thermoflexales bacterium]